MFSFSPPPGGTKIGCCIVFCCVLSTVSVSIQVISFRLLVVELFIFGWLSELTALRETSEMVLTRVNLSRDQDTIARARKVLETACPHAVTSTDETNNGLWAGTSAEPLAEPRWVCGQRSVYIRENPKYSSKPRSFENRAYGFLHTTQEKLPPIRLNLLHG